MLQRLVKSPRYTFSKEALWRLDCLGMGSSFQSIQVCSAAAIVRMALRTSATFSKMQQLLWEASDEDESLMSALVTRDSDLFDTPGIVKTMQCALDNASRPDLCAMPWQQFLHRMLEDGETALQRNVVSYLQKVVHPFDPVDFMSRRLGRWQANVSDVARSWWSFSGALFLHLCLHELDAAPECVVAACLKTALNGWTTSRRFKETQVRCVFGRGSKQDCLEHYLACRRVECIWDTNFGGEWGNFECRLAFGSLESSSRIKRAFFLYGIHWAYSFVRHSAATPAVTTQINIVKGQIIYALGRSTLQVRSVFANHAPTGSRIRDSPQHVGEVMFSLRKRQHAALAKGVPKRKRATNTKTVETTNLRSNDLRWRRMRQCISVVDIYICT